MLASPPDWLRSTFIAAVAITGSPRQAARAIGRHQFGAEQLRNHRNGKSFAAAWDAAMDLAREREVHRIHANLAELAAAHDHSPPFKGGAGGGCETGTLHPDCDYDPDIHTDDYPEYWESMTRIRERLLRARRLLLFLICEDEEKRRAWEVLVGPADWDKAMALEPQPDEPVRDPERNPWGMPNMTQPDAIIAAEMGLLPDLTGGRDVAAELVMEAQRLQAEEAAKGLPSGLT